MTPEAFRKDTIKHLIRAQADQVFLPYLDRVNALSYAVTLQHCCGHMPYRGVRKKDLPDSRTGLWGYLQMAATIHACEWLFNRAKSDRWDSWIWVHGSQIPAKGARDPQLVEGVDGWGVVAFAWDARHWPRPAEDICAALEAYRVSEVLRP